MRSWIVIHHGGQTGVDRGAHEGAISAGLASGGFMPADGRDELGPIPDDVRSHLIACPVPGLHARTAVNIRHAHALLVVVADAMDPWATPGTKTTLDEARKRAVKLPRMVVDPTHPRDRVELWVSALLHSVPAGREFRLMVAGPRASLWPDGQAIAAVFVRALATMRGR